MNYLLQKCQKEIKGVRAAYFSGLFFEELSLSVFLSLLKLSLHFNILKDLLQTYLHVFNAKNNNLMMQGRLDGW